MSDISTASIKNCRRIADLGAPIALRMPISRVRSVTVTSMMFMTPIPPTSSEIPATIASRNVRVFVVDSAVESSVASFTTVKGRSATVVSFCAARTLSTSDSAKVEGRRGLALHEQLGERL